MRFDLEQVIGAPLAGVLEAIADPDFYRAQATIADLGRPQVLEHTRRGDQVVLRVRYAYSGEVSPALGKIVAAEKLTWVVQSTVDMGSASVAFAVVPDHYPDRLSASGTQHLSASGHATRRVVEGAVQVHIPLVGRSSERAVVGGLSRHIDAEADLLREWLVP
jgi:hypothetical protein